jgi:hypothetical protein
MAEGKATSLAAMQEGAAAGHAWTTAKDLNRFASQDGFKDWYGLRRFWSVNDPGMDQWEGYMIRWGDLL